MHDYFSRFIVKVNGIRSVSLVLLSAFLIAASRLNFEGSDQEYLDFFLKMMIVINSSSSPDILSPIYTIRTHLFSTARQTVLQSGYMFASSGLIESFYRVSIQVAWLPHAQEIFLVPSVIFVDFFLKGFLCIYAHQSAQYYLPYRLEWFLTIR
jgi:hypothetical protein